MPQALLATWRITLPYVVDGLTHKIRAYVGVTAPAGAATMIDNRSTPSALLWSDAATGLASAVGEAAAAGTTFGNATLEQLSTGLWLPIASASVGSIGVGGSPYIKAAQETMTLRDTAFAKVRVIILEGASVPPYHFISKPTGFSSLDLQIGRWDGTDTSVPNVPYLWQKSRGDRFLLSSPFVAVTGDLNDKVRRARNLS